MHQYSNYIGGRDVAAWVRNATAEVCREWSDAASFVHGHDGDGNQVTGERADQRVNAIAISANDPNAVVPSLKRAMSQGIKVVTYDSDTAPAGRQVFINQASPEDLGRSEVQLRDKNTLAAAFPIEHGDEHVADAVGTLELRMDPTSDLLTASLVVTDYQSDQVDVLINTSL